MLTHDKADYIIMLAIACLATLFASRNYFTADDAYVSYAYARNFAQGHGLVIAPGSHAFNYSSFLYTLLVGGGIWLGLTPEWTSSIINSIACFTALYLACRLTWRLSSSYLASAATGIVLASNQGFSAYASGGLETMAMTALVLAFYNRCLSYLEDSTQGRAISVALLAALTLLTRFDSVLLLLPGYWCLGAQAMTRIRSHPGQTLRHWLALDGIPVVTAILFLWGCHAYYGHALSSALHFASPDQSGMLPEGVHYLIKYLAAQSFIPYLILFLIWNHYLWYLRGRTTPLHYRYFLTLAGVVALWLLYITFSGGDDAHFRMMVPILPFFTVIAFASSALCFSHPIAKKLGLLAAAFMIGNGIQMYSAHTPQAYVPVGQFLPGKPTIIRDSKGQYHYSKQGLQ